MTDAFRYSDAAALFKDRMRLMPQAADDLGRTVMVDDSVAIRSEAFHGGVHFQIGLHAFDAQSELRCKNIRGRAIVRAGDTHVIDTLDQITTA